MTLLNALSCPLVSVDFRLRKLFRLITNLLIMALGRIFDFGQYRNSCRQPGNCCRSGFSGYSVLSAAKLDTFAGQKNSKSKCKMTKTKCGKHAKSEWRQQNGHTHPGTQMQSQYPITNTKC